MNSRFTTRTIVEAGMMLALAIVLGRITPFSLPFGGSVTAGSMIPLLLLAMMRGPAVGITVGIVYGIIDYMLGGWFVHPIQWMLDYPLAFGGLGVAGFVWLPVLRGKITGFLRAALPIAASLAGIGIRFVCHFLSGIWFFGEYAPEGVPVWWYSLTYQATYLVPEIIVSAIILVLLAPALTTYLKQRS